MEGVGCGTGGATEAQHKGFILDPTTNTQTQQLKINADLMTVEILTRVIQNVIIIT